MLDYIVKFQNNFVSSFLFQKSFPILLERGISLHNLLYSKVFTIVFDFDDWPSGSTNGDEITRGYNSSIFDLRYSYRSVFPEEHFDDSQDAKGRVRVYKIKYTMNLLPVIGMHIQNNKFMNDHISIMDLVSNSDELDIFHTDALLQVIDFKWNLYGRKHHLLGCFTHFFYVFSIINYVNQAYMKHGEPKLGLMISLGLGILYPALYDFGQVIKEGLGEYLSNTDNYIDMLYIWGSILNIIL